MNSRNKIPVGVGVGCPEVTATVGVLVGIEFGTCVGISDGILDGIVEGIKVGVEVGIIEGSKTLQNFTFFLYHFWSKPLSLFCVRYVTMIGVFFLKGLTVVFDKNK